MPLTTTNQRVTVVKFELLYGQSAGWREGSEPCFPLSHSSFVELYFCLHLLSFVTHTSKPVISYSRGAVRYHGRKSTGRCLPTPPLFQNHNKKNALANISEVVACTQMMTPEKTVKLNQSSTPKLTTRRVESNKSCRLVQELPRPTSPILHYFG